MRPVLHEVVRPHVIAVLGAQPDAGAVTKPEPPLLQLPGRDFQPFASPGALDLAVVDQPAARSRAVILRVPWRPYRRASSTMSAVSRSSSSRPRGVLRCVERCCSCSSNSAPRPRDARTRRTAAVHARCKHADAQEPVRLQARRTPAASGPTSPPSPQSSGWCRPRSDLHAPTLRHQHVTWRSFATISSGLCPFPVMRSVLAQAQKPCRRADHCKGRGSVAHSVDDLFPTAATSAKRCSGQGYGR